MMKLFRKTKKETKKVNTNTDLYSLMPKTSEAVALANETRKQYHRDTMTGLYFPNYNY